MADSGSTERTVPQVALIGCGRIGSLNDENATGPETLTHAAAFSRSPHANLVAVCDADEARADSCARRRGVPHAYYDYHRLFAEQSPDIVSVCTPTPTHHAVVNAAIDAGVRLVFCEKPLAESLEQGRELLRAADAAGTTIVVNYFRRWAPGIRRAIDMVRRGDIGAIQGVRGVYVKGLFNCGSHLIDLLQWAFEPPVAVTATGCVEDDFDPDDPTLEAVLEYERAGTSFVAELRALDHRNFFHFELDIIGTEGRLRLHDQGQEIEFLEVDDDPVYRGYRSLRPVEQWSGGTKRAMEHAASELIELYRSGGRDSTCNGADALRVLATADAIAASHRSDGARIAVRA